jgi:hypothetical protein
MWFVLARQLGMSVRRTQQEINSKEFSEWLAFESMSPSIGDRLDLQTGMIIYAMSCLWGTGKGNKKVSDFMPKFDGDETSKVSPQELKTKLLAWKSMLHGRRKNEEKKVKTNVHKHSR